MRKLLKAMGSRAPSNQALQRLASISFFLREPILNTAKLLRENAIFLKQIEQRRTELQPPRKLQHYLSQYQIPQLSPFEALQQIDSRSRILASFHFGDFVYGLHKLAMLNPHLSSKVLSEAVHSPQTRENLRAAFATSIDFKNTQLLRSKVTTSSLSAWLRSPSSQLVMFADLAEDYGECVEVEFLDRVACFPRGIATLALVNRVPILPVICTEYQGRPTLELGMQIEAEVVNGESLQHAAKRITQELVSFFETRLKQSPEQWRYLRNLPSYFSNYSNARNSITA